ncbi:GNAT family N-acetyltransferase [Aureimonas endophytica]|nr:GNAT family protein [Aureimonas endophytica]
MLRPFTISDWDHYAAYHSCSDVYRYLYAVAPTGSALDEQFRAILAAKFENDGDVFRLAVVRQQDRRVVGETLLKMASRKALQGEIGYIFNPAFAGNGYATEAATAMLRIGFEEIGFHRIYARLDALNSGSLGVVERLGFRREAHLIQNDRFDGRWGDEYVCAMLKAEWRQKSSTSLADVKRPGN